MADGLPALCWTVAAALPFMEGQPLPVDTAQVVDNSKVSDHHTVIPTAEIAKADLAALPTGERNILYLIAVRLLCAVGEPHTYAETSVVLDCGGVPFTAKGQIVTAGGWKELERAFLSTLKQKPRQEAGCSLPALTEGQRLEGGDAALRAGTVSPPAHFTEDTLLSAMERASAEDFAKLEDVEKGSTTQAQRSGLRGEKEGQRSGADARRQAGVVERSLRRRSAGASAPRPPAPAFWKSWCPPALWSEKRAERSPI